MAQMLARLESENFSYQKGSVLYFVDKKVDRGITWYKFNFACGREVYLNATEFTWGFL